MRPAYTAHIQKCAPGADNAPMTTAVATVPRDVKSFHLAKPIATELTVCTFLALAATGIWLLVLPLELLRLTSA